MGQIPSDIHAHKFPIPNELGQIKKNFLPALIQKIAGFLPMVRSYGGRI